MKGLAILFAILGVCLQHANATITRSLTYTTGVEVAGNSFPMEKSEKFDENDYLTPTEEHTGDKALLNFDLTPRVNGLALSQSEKAMYKKLVKCMHGAIPSTTVAPGHRKSTVLEALRDCYLVANLTYWQIRNWAAHQYHQHFGDVGGFPRTEDGGGGPGDTVYPPLPHGFIAGANGAVEVVGGGAVSPGGGQGSPA